MHDIIKSKHVAYIHNTQCPTMKLNKRSLPKPTTTTGWKLIFIINFIIGSQCRGFQFMLILDLWGISFHPVVVIGLGNDLLFNFIVGHCVLILPKDCSQSLNYHPVSEIFCFKVSKILCQSLETGNWPSDNNWL